MAVPVINAGGFTLISAANSTSPWIDGWGSDAKNWELTTDIKVEGTGSIGIGNKFTGESGYGVNYVPTFNATTNLIFIWLWIVSDSWINTKANHGCYIRLSSQANWTNYYDYDVGGSDVAWVGKGWRLIVLDANRTPDRTSGTAPTLTAISRIGIGWNFLQTSAKSIVASVDKVFFGNSVEVSSLDFIDGTNGIDFNENGASADTIDRNDGGSWITGGVEIGDFIRVDGSTGNEGVFEVFGVSAATLTLSIGDFTVDDLANTTARVALFVTLEDIYQKDGPTDDLWWGPVAKNRDGSFEVNYHTILGDVSGALSCHFLSRGDLVYGADQPLNDVAADLTLETQVDTGRVRVLMGESSGTGDGRVGFGGSVFTQDNRAFGQSFSVDFSDATFVEVYGTTFLNIFPGTAKFPTAASSGYLASTGFVNTGQVDPGRLECRGLSFSGYPQRYLDTYPVEADAALLWGPNADIKNSNILANTRAIEHETVGTFAYDNLKFAGNEIDVINSIAASLEINLDDSVIDATLLLDNTNNGGAQSFTVGGTNRQLASLAAYMGRVGTPTGTVEMRLYSDSGGLPATLLATSTPRTAADLVLSVLQYSFSFDDPDEQFLLLAGITYHCAVVYTAGTATDYVRVGLRAGGGLAGTYSILNGSWASGGTPDIPIEVRYGGRVIINASNGANPSTVSNEGEGAGGIQGHTIINNPVTFTVTALRTNDRVIWIRVSDGAELENKLETSGSATYQYNYSGDVDVYVQVLSGDYLRKNTVTPITLSSTDAGFPAVQANDPVYANP
ncbi:MAG: hypothetical protein OEQ75_11190 [Gemmatimonadota bacterium]|nr:hypothetical protein [Gemmatimonadota bacterium]